MIETSEDIQNRILEKYCRAIVHMRQELDNRRFGLILGAGASTDLGFPNWPDLIKRIAKHPEISAENMLKNSSSHTSISQLLFQRYKSNIIEKTVKADDFAYNRIEMTVGAGWQRIVRDALYRDVPEDAHDLMSRDKFLWAFIDVIKRSQITVNYNFDDSLERMLAASRTEEEKKKIRGYKTMWGDNVHLSPDSRVVYHPNGFLPRQLSETPSPQLVFLEDSFADQLIYSMSGHYAFLTDYLSQTSGLLIGHSLNDPTLKHLLRQNAIRHPGHCHYYIAFVESGENIEPMYEQSVSDSNFEVYNLITLFLSKEEIAALGVLLNMNDKEFQHRVEERGEVETYRYFITGSVCVGKSTAVSHFLNLKTYDEWLEPLPQCMEKDPEKVHEEEKIQKIDDWVARQVGLKNLELLDNLKGLHIIDRAPLDAFAFTLVEKWVEKAQLLKRGISPGDSTRELCPGHIIFLIGDSQVMASRAIISHRDTDAEKLDKQQEMLKRVYGKGEQGVTIVDTREKTVWQVAKEIARIIHRNKYIEANMQEWLNQIEGSSFNV